MADPRGMNRFDSVCFGSHTTYVCPSTLFFSSTVKDAQEHSIQVWTALFSRPGLRFLLYLIKLFLRNCHLVAAYSWIYMRALCNACIQVFWQKCGFSTSTAHVFKNAMNVHAGSPKRWSESVQQRESTLTEFFVWQTQVSLAFQHKANSKRCVQNPELWIYNSRFIDTLILWRAKGPKFSKVVRVGSIIPTSLGTKQKVCGWCEEWHWLPAIAVSYIVSVCSQLIRTALTVANSMHSKRTHTVHGGHTVGVARTALRYSSDCECGMLRLRTVREIRFPLSASCPCTLF